MDPNEIDKLAELSRLTLSSEEKKEFLKDFKNILEYVSEIKKVSGAAPSRVLGGLKNVMREDTLYKTPLATKEELLEEVPERDGDYVKVQQVF